MKREYFLADKPKNLSVTDWICDDEFTRLTRRVKPLIKYPHNFIVPGPEFSSISMLRDVVRKIHDHNTNVLFPNLDYHTCLNITMHRDGNSTHEMFYDRMGYTRFMTSMWRDTEIEKVIRQMKRTPLNCSVSQIHAVGDRALRDTAIHRDASLFVESRLIISLNVHDEFEIQYLKYGCIPSGFKVNHFGKTYTFNSQNIHRAYFTKATGNHRICVLLGFSPWFDFDQERQCWTSNEFYGHLHPFDIMMQSHVFGKASNV